MARPLDAASDDRAFKLGQAPLGFDGEEVRGDAPEKKRVLWGCKDPFIHFPENETVA